MNELPDICSVFAGLFQMMLKCTDVSIGELQETFKEISGSKKDE